MGVIIVRCGRSVVGGRFTWSLEKICFEVVFWMDGCLEFFLGFLWLLGESE